MIPTGGNLYLQALMILGGAIIAAPLFKRLRLLYAPLQPRLAATEAEIRRSIP